MKTLLCVVLLVGCGGDPFAPELFHAIPGDTGGSDAGASTGGATSSGGSIATGGETALETGGTTATDDAGTGGMVATGGAPETGGTGTGGATDTGGTSATGGSVATGGTTSTGGLPATGGTTSTLITHNDGLGQTWQDSVPLGTYDSTQAMKACNVWCSVNDCPGCFSASMCGTNAIMIAHLNSTSKYYTWSTNSGAVMSTTNQISCSSEGTWN